MAAEAGGSSGDFVIPDALPVLPLRDAVVLPSTAVPLAVGQPRSVRLIDEVMRGNRLVALVLQRDAKAEVSVPGDLHATGTVGMIHQFMRAPDGSVRLMVQGIERIRSFMPKLLRLATAPSIRCAWPPKFFLEKTTATSRP